MGLRLGDAWNAGSREALTIVAQMLPETLRQSVVKLVDNPTAFGETLRRRFEGQADSLIEARDKLALCQEQAGGRWEELRDLKQRNRLLAALLLHSFDTSELSWEAGSVEATLDGVKDKELLLRRDPASGTLYLRAAPQGDPEPWERL